MDGEILLWCNSFFFLATPTAQLCTDGGVGLSVHNFCSNWNTSTATWRTALTFCPDIHAPQSMNLRDIGETLDFSSSATMRLKSVF